MLTTSPFSVEELTFIHKRFDNGLCAVMVYFGCLPIGHLTWFGETHVVDGVLVYRPEYRRRGVATALWSHARTIDPLLQHAERRSAAGQAWIRSLDKSR